jgi:predicted CxxxxCH...CXXCH cytochrome family protein
VPASVSTPGHVDRKTADLTFGPLASSGGVTPSFTVSSDGSSLTCATYCHGASFDPANGTNHAPSWTTVDGSQAGCGTCHRIAPPAPHPPATGGLTSCSTCHPGTVNPDGTIDVAGGLHIDGAVQVGGVGCASCHGDATRSPSAIAPAPPVGTHGETATTTRAVGAHQAHLVAGNVRAPVACTECHVVPGSTTGHPDGNLTVTFGTLASAGGAAPAWNGTSCASTYCHGATLGAGGSATQPVWTLADGSQRQCGSCHAVPPPASSGHPSVGSALTGCAACHPATVKPDGTIDLTSGKHIDGNLDVVTGSCTGCHGGTLSGGTGASGANPVAAAPPVDTGGSSATSSPGVGAHARHLLGGSIRTAMVCSDCHAVPGDTAHASQPLSLTWSALAGAGGVTPSWNGSSFTCTNYCHGASLSGGSSVTPVWTQGSSQAACGTCHGLPPPTGHHSTHQSEGIGCGSCHPGYSTTSVDTALHVNGTPDVSAPGWNGGNGSCSNSCHGRETW